MGPFDPPASRRPGGGPLQPTTVTLCSASSTPSWRRCTAAIHIAGPKYRQFCSSSIRPTAKNLSVEIVDP
jgi:hypothetical protein